MAIDLSRFVATFFDEATEHLETIEERAMALQASAADPEIMNTIFRAAHSIKGGSGTFGFTQLTDATHEMETLFDIYRKGLAQVDESTVRLLLDACDVFKAHLATLKAGGREHDPAMEILKGDIEVYRQRIHGAPAAATATPDSAQSESFLVDDEPVAQAEVKVVAIAPPAAVTPAPGGKEAFGFFEPLPEKPQAATADSEGEVPKAAEKYGFFEPLKDEPQRRRAESSSIRVGVEKIDRVVNLVGELVVAQAMLQQSARDKTENRVAEDLTNALAMLDRNTRELQQAVMAIRMMPMEFVFSRFPRLVYDVSSKLGKKVNLTTQGHETELDKELIELLVDPLTHVVRNAIDHGLEDPAARVAAGKSESGNVNMRATHRGGSVLLEVTDDGRGLDRDRILAKARERGMLVTEGMTDEDVWNIIFEPGFSTASEVTSFSGRGVGMDVVRRNITSLGGSVQVFSKRGAGTTITLQVPLTLAVMDGMIVAVGEEQYIVPIEFVQEALMPGTVQVRSVANEKAFVVVRGDHLPIIELAGAVGLRRSAPEGEPLCLVVEIDGRRAAIMVDSLIGQQQLVVKSLDTNLRSVQGLAGATILGDGKVALILDVASLLRNALSARLKLVA